MKVSVIIPYNKDRGYLDKAIESVDIQTYKNTEVILYKSDNKVGYNLNKGIEASTGDLIVYLCDDDLLPAESIEHKVKGIKDYDFIHSNGIQFKEDGTVFEWKLTDPVVTLETMVNRNGIMGGTTMYRRDIFDEFMFDEELWTAEEYDFHMMLLQNGKRLGYVNETTYLYRRHDKQKSLGKHPQAYRTKRREEIQRIANKYK